MASMSESDMSGKHVVHLMSANQKLKAKIDLNGGMLSELWFDQSLLINKGIKSSEHYHSILHKAPWLKENYESDAPALDNHLSGEWACVPFGFVTYDHEVFKQGAAHGLPCHSKVDVKSSTKDGITLHYQYPKDSPLQELLRTIELIEEDDELKVNFSFTVIAKDDCKVPLGAHPCFPLYNTSLPCSQQPLTKSVVKLDANFDFGMVYPVECEKGVSRLLPQSTFTKLSSVKLLPDYCNLDGNTSECNLERLPLPYRTEEIVQLLGIKSIALHYKELGYILNLSWDDTYVKSALLWISNEGRSYEPWRSQNRCLGIEPIASAWDMGDISTKDNPIKSAGYPTYVELKKDTPFTFKYSLAIKAL